MFCYKDRTFCNDSSCANFNDCHKALTFKVKEEAIEWWGGTDVPISLYSERLNCYVPRSEDA